MEKDYKKLYIEKEINVLKASRFVGWIMFLPLITIIIDYIRFGIFGLSFLHIIVILLAIIAPFKIIRANKKIKELKSEKETYTRGN